MDESNKIIKLCRYCQNPIDSGDKSIKVFCSKHCREKQECKERIDKWIKEGEQPKKKRDPKTFSFNDGRVYRFKNWKRRSWE